jgi:hypothetical protein
MLLYTGMAFGHRFDELKRKGFGILITPSKTFKPLKTYRQIPCALDNGAFTAYKKGYPFMERDFLFTLNKCYDLRIPLNFIVCPDMVAGGLKSLELSMKWATSTLFTAPRLALVVQDGMTPKDLTPDILKHFTHIFIGGTVEWKWNTAEMWSEFSHHTKKKLHIGRAGTQANIQRAKELNADSIDSTSIIRNWESPNNVRHAINTGA